MSYIPSLPKPVTNYDIKLLRIFRVIAECGGFAAAESSLNLTRSTISIHIKSLEERLGLVLCSRGRKGFRLTPQGEKVYQSTVELMAALEQFSHEVHGLDQVMRGELVIYCSDDLALIPELKLPDSIATIARKQPQLQIALESATIPKIEQAVLQEKAHAGILPHYRNIDGLNYYPLLEQKMYLACGRNHSLFSTADAALDDKIIDSYATVHAGVELNEAGRKALKSMNITARAYHYEMRAALVLAGTHLGFFPKNFIKQYLANGTIRLIKPDHKNYTVQLSLVIKPGSREDQKTNFLKQTILTQLKEHQKQYV